VSRDTGESTESESSGDWRSAEQAAATGRTAFDPSVDAAPSGGGPANGAGVGQPRQHGTLPNTDSSSGVAACGHPVARRRVPPRILLRLRPTGLVPLLQWPPSRRTIVRVGIAVAIVLSSVLTNRSFVGWGLFATIAVLLVPVGRVRSALLSFVPYAGVWFIFSALRSFADETMLAQTMNTRVWNFERWLFGGQLPTITLQDRFFNPAQLRFQDYFLTGIHWSYFIVPHIVAVRIWHRDPRLFRQYLSAMTLLLGIGLCIYFLVPSDPPWLSPDPVNSPAAAQVQRIMDPVGNRVGGGLYDASYKVIGESNPIAAMPSIHMAITWLLFFIGNRAGRPWRFLAGGYAICMAAALVYLGEHYVIDVVVGMLIASYGWIAARTWISRIAPALGNRFTRRPARGETAGVPAH